MGKENDTKQKSVLVVDDQQSFREAVGFEFELLGYRVVYATNGKDGFAAFQGEKFDLIVSDIRMPVWDGGRFLKEVRNVAPSTPPFVLMTGFADLKPEEAFSSGADAFLGKPLNSAGLVRTLDKILTPVEKRWCTAPTQKPVHKLELKFEGLNVTEMGSRIDVGNAGIFVSANLGEAGSSFRVGDLITLNIQITNAAISAILGLGTLRWMSVNDGMNESLSCYGIEFEYLEESCRSNLINYIQSHATAARIPNVQRQEAKALAG